MAEVHNKNASGEPSRLQPKSPWQDLGSRAASAGEEIMKFLTPPAPPAKSTQYIQPQPQATKDRRPGYIQDMDTDTMRQARVNALSDPSRAGETSAFRKQYLGENAAPYAPAPQSAPQEPEPSDDPFTAFVDKTKSEKEARRQTMQAQQPAGNALPPPHMWDGSWKNNTSQAKNPNNAIDPALAAQLEAETATRENLRIPGNSNAPKESAFTINPDAIALPPESQAADGTVTSAQTPDSSVMGPDEAIDPALAASDPALAEGGFQLDPRDIGYKTMGPERAPLPDQVPIGGDPIDEEVMTGVLEGKTPTPETPAEEARIAYLMSKRGINADRELAGQDDIRAQIAQLRGYDQMDYRPLAALVDTWTGSKMADSFKGPIDREPLIAQLNALIQKGDQHMSDADMQELKDYNDNQTRLAVAKGRGSDYDRLGLLEKKFELQGVQKEKDFKNTLKALGITESGKNTRTETMATGKETRLREDRARDDIKQDDALKLRMSEGTDANHATNLAGVGRALVKYRDLLRKTGVSVMGGFQVASPDQKALQTAYQNVFTEIAKEKKLGQLTTTDNSQVTGSLGGPSGTIGLVEWLRPGAQEGLEAQIQQGLDYIASSGESDIARLRSTAGSAHPSTHDYIDNLESEISMSVGGAESEAQEIAKLRKATREMNSLNPPERKK